MPFAPLAMIATKHQEKIKELYEVLLSVYQKQNHHRPEVSAQFHVDGFMAKHKDDPYFDDVLQMEIEDCSRPL